MKYSYTIEYTKNGILVMKLPKELELVTVFLFSDIQGSDDAQFFIDAINRVLQNELPDAIVGGNSCRLEIKKDFTTVIDTVPAEGENSECIIETQELRELIMIWSGLIDNPPPPPQQ